jgi:hypothetical protein
VAFVEETQEEFIVQMNLLGCHQFAGLHVKLFFGGLYMMEREKYHYTEIIMLVFITGRKMAQLQQKTNYKFYIEFGLAN